MSTPDRKFEAQLDRACYQQLPDKLAPILRQVLRRHHRSLKQRDFWGTVATTVFLTAIVVVVACLLDRFVDLAPIWRAPFLWLAGIFVCGGAILSLRILRRPPNYDASALALDRVGGDNRDRLRTALDLSYHDAAPAYFRDAAVAAAIQRWERHRLALVDWQPAWRRLVPAIVLLLAIAGSSQFESTRARLLWQRFLQPYGNFMRPTATWLETDSPLSTTIRSGDTLTVSARLCGRQVANPTPMLQLLNQDGTSLTRRLSPATGEVWQVAVENLQQDCTWRLFMQRARSENHTVTVLPRPTVVTAEVTYAYPKYSRLPSRTETLSGRTITALEGTKVRLELTANVPLQAAHGSLDSDETVRFRLDRHDPRKAVLFLVLNSNRKLRLELESAAGVASKQELPFTFRAVPDNAPSISIRNQLDGKSFYVTDTIEVAYRALDDIGLSELSLRSRMSIEAGGGDDRTVGIELDQYGTRETDGSVSVPISDLLSGPHADQLQLAVVGIDTKGQESISQEVTIHVAVDSFDRQLRLLLRSYTGANGVDPQTRGAPMLEWHTRRLAGLNGLSGRIAILADALDPGKPPDETHKALVAGVRERLAALRAGMAYGDWWFFDFQNASLLPRFRDLGNEAGCWSRLAVVSDDLQQAVEAALSRQDAKAALTALMPTIAALVPAQEAALARLSEDHRTVQLELCGYLAAKLNRALRQAPEAKLSSAEFAVDLAATVSELTDRATHIPELLPEADLAELSAAIERHEGATLRELRPAVSALVERLTAAAVESASAHFARPDSRLERIRNADATALINARSALALEIDDFDTDELALLRRLYALQRRQLGEPAAPLPGDSLTARFRELQLIDEIRRLAADAARFEGYLLRNGSAGLDQPEFEQHWLQLREHYLCLRRLAANSGHDEVSALVASIAFAQSWLPAEPPETLSLMRQLKQIRIAAGVANSFDHTASIYQPLHSDLLAALPLLAAAVTAYDSSLTAEIARLETAGEEDINDLATVRRLKLELLALHATVLQTLDFVQWAQLTDDPMVARLVPATVLLGKAIDHFEKKIESPSVHSRFHHRANHSERWRGKQKEYGNLLAMLSLLPSWLEAGQPLDRNLVESQLTELAVAHQYHSELNAMRQTAELVGEIGDPAEYLQRASADATDFGGLLTDVTATVASFKQGFSPADPDRLARQLSAFGDPLPKPLTDLAAFLEQARAPETTAAELHGSVDATVAKLLTLDEVAVPRVAHFIGDHLAWLQTLDTGALYRARVETSLRIHRDALYVRRVRAAQALQLDGFDGALPWAVIRLEFDRRKATVSMNRVGLGGIAAGGNEYADLKMPKHLYLELKRARSKSMPALFQDRCYAFLTRLLEKAR